MSAPAAPPPPPAAKKPQTRKSDFERETDAFNVVTDRSWLTHQNVHRLMRETFLKQGKSEEEVEAMFLETCAITDDAAGDQDLLTTILKFIGQEPLQPAASIALCHGGHRHPTTGEISGGAHWTALHLRMVRNDDGTFRVSAISTDSIGGRIPPAAVTRVLQTINEEREARIEYIRAKLSPDLQGNETFTRALTKLARNEITRVQAYEEPCEQQADGHSCGYHAVFNLARMHDAPPLLPTIQQDGRQVGPAEFITARRRDLKAIFAGPVLRERVVAPADPAKAAADQAAMTPSEKEAAKIYKIIFADDMTGDGRHVVKLKKLMEAEQRLLSGGEKNVLLLSELQLEKHYERIICEWVEELKDKVQKGAAAGQNIGDELHFLDDLKIPEAWQNPKAVFEVLSAVSSGIAGDKDFLRAEKIGELRDQWEEEKKEADTTENWTNHFNALEQFFQNLPGHQDLPESRQLYQEIADRFDDSTTWQERKEFVQKIHATIQTEKIKQKVFGELEFFEDNAGEERKLLCSGVMYNLRRNAEGIIEILKETGKTTDPMEVVDPAEQNSILSKLEKEIRVRDKQVAETKPKENFAKERSEIIQAEDGSIKFKVTRIVDTSAKDHSAKDPFEKFAKDDAKNWQEVEKLDHHKVKMVKWDKLEKDDERWELKDGKVELKPIEPDAEKAGRKAGAKVAITTLDRDLMSYYLHGKSGAAVEAQKKKYGVEKTVEKISDLEKPETVIKLISVRAMKERGNTGIAP